MTSKECLAKLGDGKESSFPLRNDNKQQLACLLGHERSDTCEKWDKCLSENPEHKAKLIAFLRVGVGKGRSLTQVDLAAKRTAAARVGKGRSLTQADVAARRT